MNKIEKIQKIQFITDSKDKDVLIEQVKDVISAGIKWIQFRMKNESIENKLSIGKIIRKLCSDNGVKLIVNDDVSLAKELNADGVHLGLDDMDPILARQILGENSIIGATCNTFSDVLDRNNQKVDYIGLGPFQFTTTKKNLSPIIGIKGYEDTILKMKSNNIDIPIIAIGGITIEDIKPIMKTEVYGIAISSLITKSKSRIEVIKNINKLVN